MTWKNEAGWMDGLSRTCLVASYALHYKLLDGDGWKNGWGSMLVMHVGEEETGRWGIGRLVG